MNKKLSLMAASLLLAGASNAFAAPGADLTVTGLITPSACTPELSNGGVVDHGKISIKDLAWNTKLEKVTLQLKVDCAASTFFAIKSTDNRKGSATNDGWDTPSLYGLGLSADNQKLGNYGLTMENAIADGTDRLLIESANGNTWFHASPDTVWQPGWMRSVSAPGYIPAAVQNLLADLVIATTVRKPTMTTDEIRLDGSATLDVVYL
ncbi:DUF1120 domain-containing protein [Pseudomonas sp. TMB3-21]